MRGEFPSALARLEEALSVIDGVISEQPANPQNLRKRGQLLAVMGAVLLRSSEPDGALIALDDSLSIAGESGS